MHDPRPTPPDVLPSGDDAGLFSLLYVSEMISPRADEVARICERSRDNNLRDRITGLLVFDGQAFCQYVEGPPAAVAALRDRLLADARHVRMRILQFGPSGSPRRFARWRLGYAFSADPAAIRRIEQSDGDRALDTFARWLRSLPSLAPQD